MYCANANNDAAAIDGVEAGKYEVLAADGTVYGDCLLYTSDAANE